MNFIYMYIYICTYDQIKCIAVKFICSSIYIFLTRILQSLAKQQEAYLVHQACQRGKETNLASSVELCPKWYLYGSLTMATL